MQQHMRNSEAFLALFNGILILINRGSEKNRTGVYTSSINAISYASAARVARNTTLLNQWLKELDQQFNASNPSIGRRQVYQIERARLLPQSQEASIE